MFYPCSSCSACFTKFGELVQHWYAEHDEPESLDWRPYVAIAVLLVVIGWVWAR